MALVTRLSRLFQADVHAVLDRIEEPDLQLKQAVREMQLALDQDRQRVKLLQHEATQLARAVATGERALETFDEELDICLAADKDDLARDLVRRKLATANQLRSVHNRAETVSAQIEALECQIEEQAQQLADMQQKLELLVGDESHPDSGVIPQCDAIRAEEIEIALLREKQRRAGA